MGPVQKVLHHVTMLCEIVALPVSSSFTLCRSEATSTTTFRTLIYLPWPLSCQTLTLPWAHLLKSTVKEYMLTVELHIESEGNLNLL